jgi:flagellin-like protein
MMKRKAISEIYSAALMFAVTLAIAGLVIAASTNQFGKQQQSALQMLTSSQNKMSESVSFIAGRNTPGGSEVEVVNYGMTNLQIDSIMVDGTKTSYTISYINGTTTQSLPVREPIVIDADRPGSKMQLVTSNGSIFEFSLY